MKRLSDFIVIALTSPVFYPGEEIAIEKILSANQADLLHIRKPGASEKDIESLIMKIKPELYPRIKLHEEFQLLEKYPLGGVHLNSRNPVKHPLAKTCSASVHTIQELGEIDNLDYYFLSPVFDSISKKGYKAAFNLASLSPFLKDKKVVALGGVTPDKFPILKNLGFSGAAMLGYFFPDRI